MAKDDHSFVWVFMGESANQPSAVFATQSSAEDWISKVQASGMLTAYPLGMSVYDWAIERGFFNPSRPYQQTAKFIGKFSSAYLEHFHYDDGRRVDDE